MVSAQLNFRESLISILPVVSKAQCSQPPTPTGLHGFAFADLLQPLHHIFISTFLSSQETFGPLGCSSGILGGVGEIRGLLERRSALGHWRNLPHNRHEPSCLQ